jgi:hypothetical protein
MMITMAKRGRELSDRCRLLRAHSSNRSSSDWMIGDLELGGWKYQRVAPIRDDWIESQWRAVVAKLLKV